MPLLDAIAFHEFWRKYYATRDDELRTEPLESDELEGLYQHIKKYHGLPLDFWHETRHDLLRKFILHGLIDEKSMRGRNDHVRPLTLSGLKVLMTYSNSHDLRYDLDVRISSIPLFVHNRALCQSLDMRIVRADASMAKAYKNGRIKSWAYRNDVCVIWRNAAEPSFWVHSDDIPLFRLRWENARA